MTLIRLFLICQYCIISRHDIHNQFWKKDMALTLTRNFKIHFHWDRYELMPWYYVMILGVIYTFYFEQCQCESVKGPCDIKYFKISTAYDVWFSRYRLSNMTLATDSALLLVFINFLWAVYILCKQPNQDHMQLLTKYWSKRGRVEACFLKVLT